MNRLACGPAVAIAFATVVATTANPAIAGEPTTCKADELPVLVCLSDKQPMALCASTTAGKMPGLLHFRFAHVQKKSATVFPGSADEKKAHANFGEYGTSAGPSGAYYAVTVGETSYVAFSTGPRSAQFGEPFAGYLIDHKGRKQIEYLCDDNRTDFQKKGAKLLDGESGIEYGFKRSGPMDRRHPSRSGC